MDADIAAAATPEDIAKIEAQDARDAFVARQQLAELRAQDYRDAMAAQHADRVAAREQQRPVFSEDAEALAFKREMILALIPKYMTTGTATDPALVLKDAADDARRLKAALDELLKL